MSRRVDAALRRIERTDLARSRYAEYESTDKDIEGRLAAYSRKLNTFWDIVASLAQPAQISYACRWHLDELADLVATINLGGSTARDVHDGFGIERNTVRALIDLVARLGDFDLALLAAEAAVARALEQQRESGWSIVFYGGRRRPLIHWTRVDGIAATGVLLSQLGGPRWLSRVASEALWGCPDATIGDRIEEIMDTLVPVNRLHAGTAIVQIGGNLDNRVKRWAMSPDPFMRQLAVWWRATVLEGAALTAHVAAALGDPDRGVRDAAVQGLRGKDLPDALRVFLAQPPTAFDACGYVCARCQTINGPTTSCANCRVVGPQVSRDRKSVV